MVAVVFQRIFRAEMHQNDVKKLFLKCKIYIKKKTFYKKKLIFLGTINKTKALFLH